MPGLLGLGATVPARATTTTIDYSSGPIEVNAGDEVTIVSGGSVYGDPVGVMVHSGGTLNITGGSVSGRLACGGFGVQVEGGTVTISGGSVSGGEIGVYVKGGTVNISRGSVGGHFGVLVGGGMMNIAGGSVSGGYTGVYVGGGTVNISGGSVSGSPFGFGVYHSDGGTVSIHGCNLRRNRAGNQLGGTLQDGSVINMLVSGPITLNNAPPVITCSPSLTVPCEPGLCGAHVSASARAAYAGLTFPVAGQRSDGQPLDALFPFGTTILTWTATDALGTIATCTQMVTVTYAWSGVLQPLNADGSSVFKAGCAIPVKFQLLDADACADSLVATLSYAKVSEGVLGPVNEAESTGAATEGNQFRYSNGQYQFNWSTKGLSPGTYELQINLGDGLIRTVRLGLK